MSDAIAVERVTLGSYRLRGRKVHAVAQLCITLGSRQLFAYLLDDCQVRLPDDLHDQTARDEIAARVSSEVLKRLVELWLDTEELEAPGCSKT